MRLCDLEADDPSGPFRLDAGLAGTANLSSDLRGLKSNFRRLGLVSPSSRTIVQ
jgi:hypothetical protein